MDRGYPELGPLNLHSIFKESSEIALESHFKERLTEVSLMCFKPTRCTISQIKCPFVPDWNNFLQWAHPINYLLASYYTAGSVLHQ